MSDKKTPETKKATDENTDSAKPDKAAKSALTEPDMPGADPKSPSMDDTSIKPKDNTPAPSGSTTDLSKAGANIKSKTSVEEMKTGGKDAKAAFDAAGESREIPAPVKVEKTEPEDQAEIDKMMKVVKSKQVNK